MATRDPVPVFLWWTALSSATFRGYGLAALIYFVTDADLEPLQLVLLGTALEVAVLIAEIPTGVVADTLSRKRHDTQIFLVLGATLTLNSGAEAVDRLFNRRLIDLGFPDTANPIVWFTLLGVVGLLAGVLALRFIETRVGDEGAPRRYYLWGVGLAVAGTIVLAWAPNVWVGVAGTFVVRGIGWAIIPAVATIWVNRRTPSNVRATVQSFLGQAESVGEIAGGVALGAVAQWSTLPIALTGSAGLFLLTFAIVTRSPAGRRTVDEHAASPA